jgi:hypothetical protein
MTREEVAGAGEGEEGAAGAGREGREPPAPRRERREGVTVGGERMPGAGG